MKQIDYSDWLPFGKGGEATTYKLKTDDSVILRMITRGKTSREDVEEEYNISKAAMELGINVPAAYDFVTDGKFYGYTGQLIKGKKSLSRLIADDPSRIPEIAALLAAKTRELHAVECPDGIGCDRKKDLARWISTNKYYNPQTIDAFLRRLDAVSERHTCLHGDLHSGNLILVGDKHYWIDLGCFGFGNPCFDLARFSISTYLPALAVKYLFHVSKEDWCRFVNLTLDEYFAADENPAAIRKEYEEIRLLSLASACFMPITTMLFFPALQEAMGQKPAGKLSLALKLAFGKKKLL